MPQVAAIEHQAIEVIEDGLVTDSTASCPDETSSSTFPRLRRSVRRNFGWLDLTTKKTRRLASFNSRLTQDVRCYPGRQANRLRPTRDNSDIVLVDLPEK